MMFLNPLILFGLLAASIPILLHIFNLRKLKIVEFSTLKFLHELQQTKIRRLKIRQLLLLVLRTLLVVLVVLAFSRPTLRGGLSRAFGAQAKTTAVFVVDDSYSMTGMDDQGELLKQAKQAALNVTNILNEGDEVYLLKLSETDASSVAGLMPSHSFAAVRSAINEIKPSYVHRKLEGGLGAAAALLATSKNFSKELYVFSDFQSGVVESKGHSPGVPEQLLTPEVRLFFVPIGSRTFQNIGIESVIIPNTILEQSKPFIVQVKLRNAGENDARNALVSVFLNGIRVAQKGVDIARRKSADVELSVVPKSTGFIEGMVALEEDDLDFDNRRYCTIDIPEVMNVLIVGSPSDTRYIKLALGARISSDSSALRLQETTAEHLTAGRIGTSDVVIFSNVRELTLSQIDRLRSFLHQGGGMIVFPGAQTSPAQFNASFAIPLKLPSIAGIEGGAYAKGSFLEFERTDLRHPLFSGMFEEESGTGKGKQRSLESPRVGTVARFTPNPESVPVITLSNGAPFLLDGRVNNGRVLMFGVPATVDWSDFPVKGLFVPLLHRAVSYLAQQQTRRDQLTVGEEVRLNNPRVLGNSLSIIDPQKSEFPVRPSTVGTERSVRFAGTNVPGIYVVKSDGDVVEKFAVNIDPDESDTAPYGEAALDRMYKRLKISPKSVTIVKDRSGIRRSILESRFGVELWKYFLIAALIAAIAEMLVARDRTHESVQLTAQPLPR